METTRNMKSLIEEAKAENKRLWKDVQVYAGIAGLDPIIVDHCVNVCAELSLDANQLAEKLNDGYPGFDPDKNHENWSEFFLRLPRISSAWILIVAIFWNAWLIKIRNAMNN